MPFMRGDFQRALETAREVPGYMGPHALSYRGRDKEAFALAREMECTNTPLPVVHCA